MNIGIDHGYYAIKTRHCSFPAGITAYSHEPYTLQNTLEYEGRYYVCGTGRQPILRDKAVNGNYYLLTLAAIAKEIKYRGEKPECSVVIGAGLPLTTYGREKKPFRNYLLRSSQPVCFKFEGEAYKVTIRDVLLFPQGYSAIVNHPEFVREETFRRVLREELRGIQLQAEHVPEQKPERASSEPPIPQEMMGFLTGLMGEG